MAMRRLSDDQRIAELEEQIAAYDRAVREGRSDMLAEIAQRVTGLCTPERVVDVLMGLLARYASQKAAITSALKEKNRLLDSLLAEPRRIDRVLGLVCEPLADGTELTWAVLEGPPHQAARFAPTVRPEDVTPKWPEEPTWVWLVESKGTLVVAGRIEPPPLLRAGLEREMVFEGLDEAAEEGVEHVE